MNESMQEMKARREAEWALAKLNEPAVQALFIFVPEEFVKMAWMLGWQQGMLSRMNEQLIELRAATDKAMGKSA